jgi:hypothetical protein
MLAEANATAQRSITVGADVLGSLETQRAQLISTQGTLAEQQSDLNREGYVETKPCMAGQRGPTGWLAEADRSLGKPEAWPHPESSLRRASWPWPSEAAFRVLQRVEKGAATPQRNINIQQSRALVFCFVWPGAGTLVGQMTRRALTNKVVLRVIALTLLALIIIILVAKYAPRSGHSDH